MYMKTIKIEGKPNYKVNMEVWHGVASENGPCYACLGGALFAKAVDYNIAGALLAKSVDYNLDKDVIYLAELGRPRRK